MSEMLGKLVTMLSVDHILSPEAAEIVEHVTLLETIADQARNQEIKMVIEFDSTPMMAAAEKIRGELETTIFNHLKGKGYTMPPAGSEWIPIDRVSELEHREGVIVTDDKTWGLSHYNAHRPKTPFPVIYDVCDWDTLGEITHVRRMTAIALPDGSLMVEPQPVILNRDTTTCPDCKTPLQRHQMQGMRLLEEVKVKGKPVTVYQARCVDCGHHHWVRK